MSAHANDPKLNHEVLKAQRKTRLNVAEKRFYGIGTIAAEKAVFTGNIDNYIATLQNENAQKVQKALIEGIYNNLTMLGKSRCAEQLVSLKTAIETAEQELTTILSDPSLAAELSSLSPEIQAQVRRKKERIAELEISIEHDLKSLEDAAAHYELFDKINKIAQENPTPATMRQLKKQTKRINNAIEKQQAIRATLKNEALNAQKAFPLLSKEESELARHILSNPPKTSIKDIEKIQAKKVSGEMLTYIQAERGKRDASIDYELSRKIFENIARNQNNSHDITKQLKKEFTHLSKAIKTRDAYRKDLNDAENRQLKYFNEEAAFAISIAKMNEAIQQEQDKTKKEELIAELKIKLEERLREKEKIERDIDDANRLHHFANKLMEEASKTGNIQKLEKQRKELKAAADRQKKYSNRLTAIEQKIARADRKKPKKPNNQERHDLRKKQLAREREDAKIAHAMMGELIDQAAEKGDTANLPTQVKQLREGIGGKRKYMRSAFGQTRNRLALEKAENKHLDIKIKQEKNKKDLDDYNKRLAKSEANLKREQENVKNPPANLRSLGNLTIDNIRAVGALSVKDAELILDEKQKLRRVQDAEQDYALGRKILEKARKDKDPSKLHDQFTLMAAAVTDRNKLRKQLEYEEDRQLKKKNEIRKAEFEVTALKKRHDIEKTILAGKTTGTADFINQQAIVNKCAGDLQRQEWELKKLKRREAENKIFDERRLANAEKNARDANTYLRIIADPNASPANIKNAKDKLTALTKKIEAEKKLEKKLAPPARVKERDQYRENLEKAEEKRLEHTKKMNTLALEELKITLMLAKTHNKDAASAAYKQLEEKRAQLKIRGEQIEREEKDAALLYEFSNKLLQESMQDTSGKKAKALKKQFKALKEVNHIQKNLRDRIKTIDKKMNSSLYLSLNRKTKEQLQRQKKDLTFGHQETQKLIQTALTTNPPDPVQLAKDCKNLREGIGGRRKYSNSLFGQEKNREALDTAEKRDAKNKKRLQESKNTLRAAGITLPPTDENKENFTDKQRRTFERYQDRNLSKKQSGRRLQDANEDYLLGQKILQDAVADDPKNPSKSERLAALKKKFAALESAIKARNQLASRLEKIEKNAQKTSREDAKKIKAAEKKLATLEKRLEKASQNLAKLDTNDADYEKKLEKQLSKIDELQEKIENQRDKIKYLKVKQQANAIRNETLVKKATLLYKETQGIVKSVAAGNIDEQTAKDKFKIINESADRADKNNKKEQKVQNKAYKKNIKQSRAAHRQHRLAKAAARAGSSASTSASANASTISKAASTATNALSKVSSKIQSGANYIKTSMSDAADTAKAFATKAQDAADGLKEQAINTAKRAQERIRAATSTPARAPTPAPAPRPIPPNSISVPVSNSEIANNQAAYRLQQNKGYEIRPGKNGELQLFKQDPKDPFNSKKGIPQGTVKFETDHNQQQRMIVSFPETPDKNAIEAIAFYASHSQPNDVKVHSKTPPPGTTYNFAEPNQNRQVEKAFQNAYKSVNTQQKTTLLGTAAAQEQECDDKVLGKTVDNASKQADQNQATLQNNATRVRRP